MVTRAQPVYITLSNDRHLTPLALAENSASGITPEVVPQTPRYKAVFGRWLGPLPHPFHMHMVGAFTRLQARSTD